MRTQLEQHMDAWFGGAAVGVLLCAIVTGTMDTEAVPVLYSLVVLAWIIVAFVKIKRRD